MGTKRDRKRLILDLTDELEQKLDDECRRLERETGIPFTRADAARSVLNRTFGTSGTSRKRSKVRSQSAA
jgi:hypothetical protein